ncbi:MAG: acetate--CoA ligase [Euryarchaeota archaeon]|nr:acetate--CoA ligase [Euryarchaeota archaeon]MDE1837266.1 acetate--CoA ligase [Euryarchaeota archaeon]MDE1879936.1 acetate--CoA ligase [Euryarchaeota archaeon]MDE2045130.1 acetate--CoA ligase [Thermoplasmata archaeon]
MPGAERDRDETQLPFEQRYVPSAAYRDLLHQALRDPERFWRALALREIHWDHTFSKVVGGEAPFWKWFEGGLLNASYNCLDRHLEAGRGSRVAYHWEGEPGDTRTVTYRDLLALVERSAGALSELGLHRGDRIALYLPMIPETPAIMLAAARLGIVFTTVFSGFSAESLAGRIRDSGARAVVTADGTYRRGKFLALKPVADQAAEHCPSVEKMLVVQRGADPPALREGRDVAFLDATKRAPRHAAAQPLPSDHPLYMLYTSGTTGRPKGVVHGTGGYLVHAAATMRWVFDDRPESDTFWCAADIGWVTGHTYIVFGPLLRGMTSVLYEGGFDIPTPDRMWSIVERYGVTTLYTSPTAIRSLMKHGDAIPRAHDLSSLRLLGTVGEAINPAAWEWYYRVIGGERCPIVDTWWQTETGGILISPAPGLATLPLKPGSATLPLPGVDADVVDEQGKPVPALTKGFLVVRRPWPGMFLTLYNDPERFRQVYFSRFPGVYYTGDYAVRDLDGYFWLLGRADEVLKVAGHRLGTIEIEDALVSHPAVAEAAVVGQRDDVKGEVIAAFVTLRSGRHASHELSEELRRHVREVMGPVATPEAIHFVAALPKTRSGKIMRRVIRAVANQETVGDVTTLEDEATVEEVRREMGALRHALGREPASKAPSS